MDGARHERCATVCRRIDSGHRQIDDRVTALGWNQVDASIQRYSHPARRDLAIVNENGTRQHRERRPACAADKCPAKRGVVVDVLRWDQQTELRASTVS